MDIEQKGYITRKDIFEDGLGFVELIDILGGDHSVVASARVSHYADGSKGIDSDTKLIRYLMKNKHTSPFESVVLTFRVKVPLFVRGQWHRHRALNINTPIPTPHGWKLMKDININDYVLSYEGTPAKVIGMSDIKIDDIYRVYFDDNSYIDCSKDHLWNVYSRNTVKNKKLLTYTTERLMKSIIIGRGKRKHFNYMIPITNPIQLDNIKTDINLYLFGIWLGDGSKRDGRFASADNEIIKEFEKQGFNPRETTSKYLYSTKGFTTLLRKEGVLNNKHIPEKYLRGSYEQRLSLLQGLMDSDGDIRTDGKCKWANTNRKLIEQVHELILSLGIKCSLPENKSTNGCYNLLFSTNLPIFKLSRKLNRISKKEQKRNKHRTIINIENNGKGKVKCIEIDAPSKLYLAGKNMIPTHNTWSYNEVSRRYTSENIDEFFYPEKWRAQDTKNKQSSVESAKINSEFWNNELKNHVNSALELYESMIKNGIAREQARMVLPQNMYTMYYGTVNLHNLLHFLGLRIHPHAQEEIRMYAYAIMDMIKEIVPISFEAWWDYHGDHLYNGKEMSYA